MSYQSILQKEKQATATTTQSGYKSILGNVKPVIKETPKTKIDTLPDHLGGGSYNTIIGEPNTLLKTKRGYANIPSSNETERHHIIPVEFGGDSTLDKNIVALGEKEHARITAGQRLISSDYNSGKISLGEARVKVMGLLQKEQFEKQGVTESIPKNLFNIVKENIQKLFKGGAGPIITQAAKTASKETGKNITPENYAKETKNLPLETKNVIKAQTGEKLTEQAAQAFTAPTRFTAGSLATLETSLALERANSDAKYTPKTDAEKLILGEGDIQRLMKQEDLYGTIARGAGVPVALLVGAIIENPFIQGTGLSKGIKEILERQIAKQGEKYLSQIGAKEIIKIADDVIKSEVKAGKLAEKDASKALKELNSVRVREVAKTDTPNVSPASTVEPKIARSDALAPEMTKVSSASKIAKVEPIKYVPEEKAVDLRNKITSERLIAEPSIPNRIKDEAIEKGLKADFGGIDDYNKVSFKDQAKLVGEIIDQDPAEAINIALGKSLPKNGALPESVFIAVKNKAIKNGDTDLLIRLATEEGGVAKESTVLGQRIKMLDEQLETDAFRNINKTIRDRAKAFEAKGINVNKIKGEEINKIKGELSKVKPKVDDWAEFLDSIKCNTK